MAVWRDSGVSTEARRREVDSPRLSPGEGCEPQRPGLGPRGSSEAGEVGAVCGLRVGREGWTDVLGFTPQRRRGSDGLLNVRYLAPGKGALQSVVLAALHGAKTPTRHCRHAVPL